MGSAKILQGWARPLLAVLALGLFLTISDPLHVPSVLLIIPFLLLFMALYCTLMELIATVRAFNDAMTTRVRRPRVIAALVAALPVSLLVLKSIGQLSIWDIVTAVTIVVVAYIYVSRSAVGIRR